MTSKIHSAALEASLNETAKILEKSLKAVTIAASSYADLSTNFSSFSTTESHVPLSNGLKQLADSMRTIAELEIGQSNNAALVLGDALAYAAVEARSAKDALLQRQYNLDELHSSIKATITKRRNIEKLRGGSNIKPERVNEALDDLEEAQKFEQNLQYRIQAISTNLRPALQTHLRAMNDNMLRTLLHHARAQSAYERRKLLVYESISDKLKVIPERGNGDVVYYHQPQTFVAGASEANTGAAPTKKGVLKAAMLPPSSSDQDGQATVVPAAPAVASSDARSKFYAREAEIKAHLQEQQAAQQRQQEHRQQRQNISRSSSASSNLARSSIPAPQLMSAPHIMSSPAQQEERLNDHSPLQSGNITRANGSQVSQSMFIPTPHSGTGEPTLHSPRLSPSRRKPAVLPPMHSHPRFQAQTVSDPLSTTSATPEVSPSRQVTAPSANRISEQGSRSHIMAQSVFLPGKSANAGRAGPPEEDRKRSDARKAASLLAGAF